MGHTVVSVTQASSVTLQIWQHGAKESYCKFETSKMVVNTKTSIIQIGAKRWFAPIERWLENESKPITNF